MKKIIITLFTTLLVLSNSFCFVCASDGAKDITKEVEISSSGYSNLDFLSDGNLLKCCKSKDSTSIEIKGKENIGSLYLIFDYEYGVFSIEDLDSNNKVNICEKDFFLHCYIDVVALLGNVKNISIHFDNGSVSLNELTVYSIGEVPSTVQKWQQCAEGNTDILLCCTHSDDDQLFFAGLVPKYTSRENCTVQVAYFTNHRSYTTIRIHEVLDGLYTAGLRNYPVFESFRDFNIGGFEKTMAHYNELGVSEEMLQLYVVELYRRFKPLVVVGHDINGEYGHGMHRVYSYLVRNAITLAADETKFIDSFEKYGSWQVEKVYLHLYSDNQIVIDYDTPLESGVNAGLTPFYVSQKLAFPCHKSQLTSRYYSWINGNNNEITKASQIEKYSPCLFGLYYKNEEISDDVKKDDFLENIETYQEKAIRLQQEEIETKRLEEEKLQQEELIKIKKRNIIILIVSIVAIVIIIFCSKRKKIK